jgi:hypothetical protein
MRRVLLAVLITFVALLFASCGSDPSGLSSDSPGVSQTPSPKYTLPVSDPSLPAECIPDPTRHWSSEVGSSHLQRQSGGAIKVAARAIPKANYTFVVLELDAFEHYVGNCFYSAKIVSGHRLFEIEFGFQQGTGSMNPQAVAAYLKLQRFALASVTEP